MESTTVSIIINTYNRAALLDRLLAGLGHLTGINFEVIVVNGPSTDDTVGVLERYHGRIKVGNCPTRNLSRSRNIGLSLAAGDVVLFIDDDALPADTDWLSRYTNEYNQNNNSRIGAIGGPVLHRDTKRYEFHGGYTSDYGMQIFNRDEVNYDSLSEGRWLLGVPGGNMAFRRKAILQVGGFDEFYIYYLDETDVCMRLARAGYEVKYLPENGIRHYAVWSSQPILKRNWRVITRSDTYFALKNGRDPVIQRIINTLRLAPKKHFFIEMKGLLQRRDGPITQRLSLIYKWFSGYVNGFWNGLFKPRHLGVFSEDPPAFLDFSQAKPERRLKIAFLTKTIPGQPNYGGIGRYTYDLAYGLHERGHEVHILCKDEKTLWYESLGFCIHGIQENDPINRSIIPEKPILNKNVSYGLAIVRKLEELCAEGIVFDVIHASNWDAEMAALIRAQAYPTVLMLVSSLAQVSLTEKWLLNDDLQACIALDRWQIEQADRICAPSKGVLNSYKKLMDIDDRILQSVQVVSLGIHPKLSSRNINASGQYKLLFVGRLERRKGIHTLLEILPDLASSFPNWDFHIVGNDNITTDNGKTFKEQFETQHKNSPWFDRVVFHGEVSEHDLDHHYQTCDLFVAPSLFESFGLIFHEAMQYGKAVVGCRTGGVPEVVEHGVDGLLVTPDCPDELFRAISQLMRDDILRERMGCAGQERVHQKTNYRTMAAEMEKVYYSVIAEVGDVRRTRIARWPRDISLFTQSPHIILQGPWEEKDAVSGQRYLKGMPGASISFRTRGGTSIRVISLRHNWSGVLKVQVSNYPSQIIDLFLPDGFHPEERVDIPLPGSQGDCLDVVIRVLHAHHPESHASEIWLKKLLFVPVEDMDKISAETFTREG